MAPPRRGFPDTQSSPLCPQPPGSDLPSGWLIVSQPDTESYRFMFSSSLRGAGSAAILLMAATAQNAFCQASDPPPPAGTPAQPETGELRAETVIVTGSKRDTALIDSDLAVTVLDSRLIADARLRDFSRIDDLVPNVKFNESGQRGSIYITVRGVESNPFIVNRAAVYIDGIPFRELSNSVLNEVESIEVLRGPQGTLYGANSESGLIIVRSKAPSDVRTGSLRLTGESYSSGNAGEVSGFLSGPLVEGILSGSLSFNLADEDAYVKNIGTSTGNTGEIGETFLQGRLRWTPNDRLTFNATGYWRDLDAPGIFDQQYVPLDTSHYNRLYADVFNGGRRIGKWSALEDAPKHTREEEWVFGTSATLQLSYGTLDFAASYRELDEDARGLDFDLTSSPLVSGQEAETEAYKQLEVRFTSPKGETFDYIVGGSYYEEFEERTLATFLGSGGLNAYRAAPPQRKDGEDVSVFGSANWYATSALKFGGGLRYERAKRGSRQRAGDLDLGFGTVISYTDADLSKSFDILLPRVSVLYKVNENFSLNASAGRGYIPGGFNLAAVQEGISSEDIISYDSETLWSREIGFKWQSETGRLRASGAVFHIISDNWQEIQISLDETGRPTTTDYIGSDASIRSRGAEFEASWQPDAFLTLSAHMGYVDAKYRQLTLGDGTDLRGKRIQFVPEYDAGLSARYQWATGFFARAEAGFTGDTSLRARGDAVQPAVATLGVQVGYEGERFTARLFGENLTDERRASGLAIDNMAYGSDGTHYAPLDAPRIIGIELEARF